MDDQELTPREAWLLERRTGIGGSDAAAAVGLSKWKTRLELFLDKRGELETPENEPMRWGTLLEPVVRQEYVNRTGNVVTVPSKIVRHPTVAFAILTSDGIAEEVRRLYEGKTSRTSDGWGEAGSDEVPVDYMLQVQHGMFVTGLPVADIAVLIGGSDFRIYTVNADAELQAILMAQEAAFWACVQANEPPEPMSREDVKRRWRRSSGLPITCPDDIGLTVKKLAVAKQIVAIGERRVDELSATIQSYMGAAAELVDEDGEVVATWKNVNTNPRFDLDKFRIEQAEMHAKYLRPAQPQRRFLVSKKVTSSVGPITLQGESECLTITTTTNPTAAMETVGP